MYYVSIYVSHGLYKYACVLCSAFDLDRVWLAAYIVKILWRPAMPQCYESTNNVIICRVWVKDLSYQPNNRCFDLLLPKRFAMQPILSMMIAMMLKFYIGYWICTSVINDIHMSFLLVFFLVFFGQLIFWYKYVFL